MTVYRQLSIMQFGTVNAKSYNLNNIKSGSIKKRGLRDITNASVESPKSRYSWRNTQYLKNAYQRKTKLKSSANVALTLKTNLLKNELLSIPILENNNDKSISKKINVNDSPSENSKKQVKIFDLSINFPTITEKRIEPLRCNNLNEFSSTSNSKFHSTFYERFSVAENFNDSNSFEDYNHYSLPIVSKPQVQNRGFASISTNTLRQLLSNSTEFNNRFTLFDCRYPYEFNGGHIQNAINLYDYSRISSIFFPKDPIQFKSINSKIPIFYCEFSQKRSVKMAMELRNQDRQRNAYPFLHYTELYILDYGYQKFFIKDKFTDLCTPSGYVPMIDKHYCKELKLYDNHKKTLRKNISAIEYRTYSRNQKQREKCFIGFSERRSFTMSFPDDELSSSQTSTSLMENEFETLLNQSELINKTNKNNEIDHSRLKLKAKRRGSKISLDNKENH